MLINHRMENSKFIWKQSGRLSLTQVMHKKMAQWVIGLLCKPEDLSSDSEDPRKKLHGAAYACNPSTGAERLAISLPNQ